MLFWKHEGSFEDLSTFRMEAVDVFPMQKGTQGYTEFTFDEKVFDYQMGHGLMDCRYGLIHSHNNMNTFFSGTDDEELQENAPNHNCYLSLIVNNRMDMCARLAVAGSISYQGSKFNFTTPEGDGFSVNQEVQDKKVVFYHDCNISKPALFHGDDEFSRRVEEICTVEPKATGKFVQTSINNVLDADRVEKFLVKFFGGTGKDTLDKILTKVKYDYKYSAYTLLNRAKSEAKFKFPTDGDEVEFIEEVLSVLEPYEYNNLEELKNKYNDFVVQQSEKGWGTVSQIPNWNGYGSWSY